MAKAHYACSVVCGAMLVDPCLFGLVTALVFKRTDFCFIPKQIPHLETLFNFACNDSSFWYWLTVELHFYSAEFAVGWIVGELLLN